MTGDDGDGLHRGRIVVTGPGAGTWRMMMVLHSAYVPIAAGRFSWTARWMPRGFRG